MLIGADAAGTLKLVDSDAFGGLLSGFDGNDLINLVDVDASVATLNYVSNLDGTGGVLTVSDGVDTANIAFSGQYTSSSFQFADDANGGTQITYNPAG